MSAIYPMGSAAGQRAAQRQHDARSEPADDFGEGCPEQCGDGSCGNAARFGGECERAVCPELQKDFDGE